MVTTDPMLATPRAGGYEELNLLRIWRAVRARRWLVIGIAFGLTVVAIAASYLVDPVYRGDVLLAGADMPDNNSPLGQLVEQYGGLANLAGIDVSGESAKSLNESIEILRSRAFTEQFIARHQLLPTLFPERWDAANGKWIADDEDGDRPPSAWKAYKKLNSARKIAKDTKTGFVKLSIEWTDPAIAARWANQMVAMLNEHLRQRAIEEGERSISYLQGQLDLTPVVDRRQMLIGLMEGETRKIVLAKARIEYAVRVLDPAVTPEEKVRPRRAIIALAALLVGLIAGILLATILQSLKRDE